MQFSASMATGHQVGREVAYYRAKYSRLRRRVVELIHENAALCHEVTRIESKVTSVKAERKYLLKRLMQYEKPNLGITRPQKRKQDLKSKKKAKANKNEISHQSRPNSSQGGLSWKDIGHEESHLCLQPLPVDSNGRPIFPIDIDGLSVYSIGDIISDRPNYHTSNFIFPVGYCSTRLFNSMKDPDTQCLYTCKILDFGPYPRFEISPEDDPGTIFASRSIEEAYSLFKYAVTTPQMGKSTQHLPDNAHDFFGLSLPVIQNLVQSLPGCKKCAKYEWKRFEVRSRFGSSFSSRIRHDESSGISRLNNDSLRQTDINIEALEKWARDQ